MQSDFYNAGYDAALEKLAWGFLGRGAAAAGKWLGNVGTKVRGKDPGIVHQLNKTDSPALNWIGGKMQGAAQGLGNSFTNFAAAPGQTLWQGAGNFAKNTIGMGNANTTSGVLGRGAMGYGVYRGAFGGNQ